MTSFVYNHLILDITDPSHERWIMSDVMHGVRTQFDFEVIVPGCPSPWAVPSEDNVPLGGVILKRPAGDIDSSIYDAPTIKVSEWIKGDAMVISDDLLEQYISEDELDQYVAPDMEWLPWRLEHWGTKWNSSEVAAAVPFDANGKKFLAVHFLTAYCEPSPIFDALKKRGIDVHWVSEYEGTGSATSCPDAHEFLNFKAFSEPINTHRDKWEEVPHTLDENPEYLYHRDLILKQLTIH